MRNYRFEETPIEGLVMVEPRIYPDDRGFFLEAWNREEFEKAGIPSCFVQDNQSLSKRGVLRGLHYQLPLQGKLIRVLYGEIYDVIVDMRISSPSFGQWVGYLLSDENRKQLYVPEGCAHGFLVTSATAMILYKCTAPYSPGGEGGIRWDDPGLAIDWPCGDNELVQSEKDAALPAWDRNEVFF